MINSSGYKSFWYECGFNNEEDILIEPISPESRARMKQKNSYWFWTYFCDPKDQFGEFVYEIRLYPTAV